ERGGLLEGPRMVVAGRALSNYDGISDPDPTRPLKALRLTRPAYCAIRATSSFARPADSASGVSHKSPLRYCRPGALRLNWARRNAAAIASPLVDAAGRRGFSDPIGAISADVLAVGASKAWSNRIVNEIRRRLGSTSNTLTRTTSPGFAIVRGSFT